MTTTTAEAVWRRRTRTPVLLATAVAWAALVAIATGRLDMGGTAHMRSGMGRMGSGMGSGMHGEMGMTEWASLSMAALMVASMMTPLLIPAVRHGAARSFQHRRKRAVTLLVATHMVVWLAGAVALQGAAPWALRHLGPVAAPVTGLAIALIWPMTPLAQHWTNQHHALPPLAAFGAKADYDIITFGTRHAASCLGACWVLMLWPTLMGRYHVAAMAIAAVWVWAQALETPRQPRWSIWVPRKTIRLGDHLGRSVARHIAPRPTIDPDPHEDRRQRVKT